MPYGTLKVDNIIFTNGGVDQTITVSGIVASTSGNLTATGTISGSIIRGGTTVSGATVTGSAGQFGNLTAVSGTFTTISGGTYTLTSGVFASGTAANPSISFVSDPNTGIYSPGADQVAISTNGSGRVFVDANGNVSIGSAVADTVGSTFSLNVDRSAGNGQLSVSANGTVRGRMFADNSTSEFRIGNPTANPLMLYTSNTERLRITSDGKVGLGTSSPTENLTVFTTTSARLAVTNTNGSSAILLGNQGGSGANNPSVIEAANGSLYFGGGSSWSGGGTFNYTMTLTDGGSVGIGTTSPGTTLDVAGSPGTSTTANLFTLRNQSASNAGNIAQMQFFCTNTFGGGEAVAAIQALNPNASANNGGALVLAVSSNGTATTPTERARIDSSGRLLVGTSSARSNFFNGSVTAGLQAESTGEGSIVAAIRNVNDAGTVPVFLLAKSRGGSVGSNTIVSSGDSLGYLSYQGSDGSEFVEAARIAGEVDGTPGANDMPGRLVFSTTADGASSPTERMRIRNGGPIDVWGGAADNTFHALSTQAAGTTYALFWGGYGSTGPGNFGTNSVKIYTNGNIQNTNNSYGALSDIKLKENIVDANSQWNDLKALQVRNYNFKEGQTHTQIGLIAQEVELVSPGLVSESPDRDAEGNDLGTVTKSVNYSVLYMKAIKALQEAMERIEVLEQRLTDAGIA